MRDQILQTIASLAERRPRAVLGISLLITLLALWQMSQLELHMHFKNLMPQDHPMVQEFNRIVDDFSSASQIIVAATGNEVELKAFADDLAPRLATLTQYVRRVDYRLERDFHLRHGLMLTKARDLDNTKVLFTDLSLLPWLSHLNDSFEKTYVYDEESISTTEKEQRAITFLDGVQHWLKTARHFASSALAVESLSRKAADRFLLGDEYFISPDKDVLLLFAQPTFSLNEIDRVVAAEDSIDALIHQVAAAYPSVEGGTTGTMALARDEMVAANEDAYATSIVAFVLIILLFILSFRMWVAPLLAGITLIVGIIWAGAFASLTVGSLNVMTSMFAVILLGLGVDFSIHVISGYTENRAAGHGIGDSLAQMLRKAGGGIVLGAFTTACAFLTLTVSETAGMREFGIVAGSGVLFCMLASLLVLPALLSWRDQILSRRAVRRAGGKGPAAAPLPRAPAFGFLGSLAAWIRHRHAPILVALLAVTLGMARWGSQLTFDYNYLNMEPVGLTSIELQHRVEDEFDVTPDFALITASSIDEARRIAEEARDLRMVGLVTSISQYLPSPEQQGRRRPHIVEIATYLEHVGPTVPLTVADLDPLTQELYRLEDNVIELAQLAYLGGQDRVDAKCRQLVGDLDADERRSLIGDLVQALAGDPPTGIAGLNRFHAGFAPRFRELAMGMANADPLVLDDLPQDIVDRFASRDRSTYLVSIYPREGVWENLEFLDRFTARMQDIDPRVTGIPSVFYVLMGIIGADGRLAATLTLIVVFVLLLLDFRSLRLALMAMVPLVFGGLWMVGVMWLSGLQLTLLNVIVVPLILGIGVDDGVHLLHRYRIEGRGSTATVFRSTGKAVLLTSLTTMLAFGSLVFATYRGLGSMGIALFIGVGTCFLTAVLIIPCLIGWLEGKE